jgi:hypothetical protein
MAKKPAMVGIASFYILPGWAGTNQFCPPLITNEQNRVNL